MSDFYSNKLIFAPMVKAGRTPLRLLALKYGADLVYTEEIVDLKLLQSKRIVNDVLKTVDYVLEDEIVLRVADVEKSRVVLQIGTNNPDSAVAALFKTKDDVAAFDVNMGCPKPFSISGGMGAALLSKPTVVSEIMKSLVKVSPIPVSCKMRLLDTTEGTLEFVRMLESTGVKAIGVHGRRKDEKPGDENRISEIKAIVEVSSVPIIASGNSYVIKEHVDIEAFRASTSASSVMVARKALLNPSILRAEGPLSWEEEIKDFLHLACEFDESYTQAKYVVQRILGPQQEFDPRGKAAVAAASVLEICRAFGMEDVYQKWSDYRKRMSHKRKGDIDVVDGISLSSISFSPKRLKAPVTPKNVLNDYCKEHKLPNPEYEVTKRKSDNRYTAVANIDGKRFGGTTSQPNMKMAEQVAALIALIGLGVRTRLPGEWDD